MKDKSFWWPSCPTGNWDEGMSPENEANTEKTQAEIWERPMTPGFSQARRLLLVFSVTSLTLSDLVAAKPDSFCAEI